tara:strand:- start:1867 stop:2085 length:219 start_codon:yes stop_codon:yes gene_type:complete
MNISSRIKIHCNTDANQKQDRNQSYKFNCINEAEIIHGKDNTSVKIKYKKFLKNYNFNKLVIIGLCFENSKN